MQVHRPIVISGNRAQFEDWCRTYRTNWSAAIYVDSPEALVELLRDNTDVRLWGDFTRNPAYPAYQAWQRRLVA